MCPIQETLWWARKGCRLIERTCRAIWKTFEKKLKSDLQSLKIGYILWNVLETWLVWQAQIKVRLIKKFKKSSKLIWQNQNWWYIKRMLRLSLRRRDKLIENWIVRCKPWKFTRETKVLKMLWSDESDKTILSFMESLILAQNERWRHGLGMQVERSSNT